MLKLLLLLYLLCPYALAQAEAIKVNADKVPLAGGLYLLEDDSKQLRISDVVGRDFQALPGNLSLGFTHAAVWLSMEFIIPPGATGNRWLDLGQPLLDDVDLYLPQADGGFEVRHGGENMPRPQWELPEYRSPAFLIPFDQPGTYRLYLRLWSRNALTLQPVLWRATTMLQQSTFESRIYGLYFGIIFAIFIFHLVFWVITRESSNGWYMFYVLSMLISNAISIGFMQPLLGDVTGPYTDAMLGTSMGVAVGPGGVFTSRILRLADVLPRFNRYYLLSGWLVGITTVVAVFTNYFGSGMQLMQTYVLVMVLLLMPIALYLIRQGHRPAKFFLFGFSFYYIGLILRFMINLGLLPPSWLMINIFQLGILLHLTLMIVVVQEHYNHIKQEKAAAQAALLQNISETKDKLEITVAERTASLRDEIRQRELTEDELHGAILKTHASLETERQARREQQEFVAMVSHEFRTPLTIIDTSIQQIVLHDAQASTKTLSRYSNIDDAIQRMTALIDEYLKSDRLESYDRSVQLQMCDLCSLTRRVIAEFPTQPIEFSTDNPQMLLHGDANLLHILICNLITNACKYGQGSAVHVALHWENHAIVLTVRDAGPGMDADEINKVFDKYFRGRRTRHQPGAGLGLHLVQHIARQHGGEVTAANITPKGMAFKVFFPAQQMGNIS